MSWLIDVDGQTCIGSGICAGTAPDNFELVDGVSHAKHSEIEQSDAVVDAAESCPVEAILVKDAGSGETVAPEP